MTDAVKKNNANTLLIKYCKNDRPLIIHDPGLGGQKSSVWMHIHVVVCLNTVSSTSLRQSEGAFSHCQEHYNHI